MGMATSLGSTLGTALSGQALIMGTALVDLVTDAVGLRGAIFYASVTYNRIHCTVCST